MMKIALVGMMGSGKTKIGRILAVHYGVEYVDLDAYIELKTHTSVAGIFRNFGERHFRELEEDSLGALASADRNMVLCCGGGSVLSDNNRKILRTSFLTIWLDVPLEELERRLSSQRAQRPLLASENWKEDLERILGQRREFYREASTVQYLWKKGQSPNKSALEIEDLILAQMKPEVLQG